MKSKDIKPCEICGEEVFNGYVIMWSANAAA